MTSRLEKDFYRFRLKYWDWLLLQNLHRDDLMDPFTVFPLKAYQDSGYQKASIVRKGRFYIVNSPLLNRVEGLFHGFFTRCGGVSSGSFRSLNVAYSTGDDIRNVKTNLELIRTFSGFKRIVQCRQVHGTKVVIAEELKPSNSYPVGDILLCNSPGIGVMIKTGDCQAVFIVDPVKRALAAVHCGWRGSVKNVLQCAVSALSRKFDSKPRDLIGVIGPSLGPCCAEFVNHEKELPKSFEKYQIRANHFNFWEISRDQLINSGLISENIEITGWCTKCNPQWFFSYRRKKVSGRMAALVGFLEG